MNGGHTTKTSASLVLAREHIRQALEKCGAAAEDEAARQALLDIRQMLTERLDGFEKRLKALETRTHGTRAGAP